MTLFPQRTETYVGPVTDSRIWGSFEVRSDDVILSTPPKCGTTWSQAILMMLIHGEAETNRQIWRDSVWLDCSFRDTAEQRARLDVQTHRRCIKSHTPLDGIIYDPRLTYICVYRHPIDTYFSMLKHVENMKSDLLDFLNPPEPGAAFARFLNHPKTTAGTDDLTLESLLHHYRSFANFADLPNVYVFHYADLSRDLPGLVRQYAAAIGLDPSDKLITQIAQAASFGSMKETARQHDDGTGAFKVQHAFFDSASSNKWEGRMSDDELAAYTAKLASMATPEEINFLEYGHGDVAARSK